MNDLELEALLRDGIDGDPPSASALYLLAARRAREEREAAALRPVLWAEYATLAVCLVAMAASTVLVP
ncbi:MAG: hypothetical protein SFV18_01650 [Bryobacteraceae bacterium]|nr:hypothetical protein [Bryobacteraceae bacterium]